MNWSLSEILSSGSRNYFLIFFLLTFLGKGEKDGEQCSLTRISFCRDETSMFFNNFFANSQANARSRINCVVIQSLKNGKNLFNLIGIKANPVIFYLNFMKRLI